MRSMAEFPILYIPRRQELPTPGGNRLDILSTPLTTWKTIPKQLGGRVTTGFESYQY